MNAAPSSPAIRSASAMSSVTDTALARAGIDDERQDTQDPVVVLEPGQRVEGDEPEDDALVLGDHDPGVLGREASHALRRCRSGRPGSPRR